MKVETKTDEGQVPYSDLRPGDTFSTNGYPNQIWVKSKQHGNYNCFDQDGNLGGLTDDARVIRRHFVLKEVTPS